MKRTMNFLVMLLMLAAASTGLTSCHNEKESSLTVNGSTSSSMNLSPSGETQTVWVRSNTSWVVSGHISGIEVFPTEGTGNTQVTIRASQNTSREARVGGINFMTSDGEASAYLNIYQDGKNGSSFDINALCGDYVGTLKPIGYSDSPARAYVTLSRLSSNAVRLTSLICEEFDMDMNPVNLTVSMNEDGSCALTSETNKSIQGSYYKGQLTLTFSNYIASFYFSGYQD